MLQSLVPELTLPVHMGTSVERIISMKKIIKKKKKKKLVHPHILVVFPKLKHHKRKKITIFAPLQFLQ